jgi:hypothetical protein
MEEPENKELTPIEKWARAQQWTEGVTDAIGVVFLVIGIMLAMLGMHEITIPTAQYDPMLKPFFPVLAEMDQKSACLAQLYIGVAFLLLSIVTLLRTRVVNY